MFYTFILSNFSLAFLQSKQLRETRKKNEERALRFVYGDFDLLAKANIPSLHISRL